MKVQTKVSRSVSARQHLALSRAIIGQNTSPRFFGGLLLVKTRFPAKYHDSILQNRHLAKHFRISRNPPSSRHIKGYGTYGFQSSLTAFAIPSVILESIFPRSATAHCMLSVQHFYTKHAACYSSGRCWERDCLEPPSMNLCLQTTAPVTPQSFEDMEEHVNHIGQQYHGQHWTGSTLSQGLTPMPAVLDHLHEAAFSTRSTEGSDHLLEQNGTYHYH